MSRAATATARRTRPDRCRGAPWLALAGMLILAGGALAAGDAPCRRYEAALAAWAEVLQRFVDDAGRIDFARLQVDPQPLRAATRALGEIAPWSAAQCFPDRVSRLAYHINAYNALAMQAVVDVGVPQAFDSVLRRARFFRWRRHLIGGRRYSLHAYENAVIRRFGEPRVHFALNCMVRGCPRLPRQPFPAAGLDAALEGAAHGFFREARNLRIDDARRTVWLSELLRFYREDFTAGGPGDLLAAIARWLPRPLPRGYAVRFIPYDWTVNRTPGGLSRRPEG